MRAILLTSLFLTAILLSACGDTAETNTARTNANANSVIAKPNNGNLQPTTPTPEATTNNAPTLTPVYKAYCAAWVKKDEAALRKIYSSDTIRSFEQDMKEQDIRSLSDYLSDDKASNELCEARNEKISGDTATAEVKTLGYPNGIVAVFVKENGEWKLTNRRPEGALK